MKPPTNAEVLKAIETLKAAGAMHHAFKDKKGDHVVALYLTVMEAEKCEHAQDADV